MAEPTEPTESLVKREAEPEHDPIVSRSTSSILLICTLLQYMTFQFFAVSVLLAMPVKLILRLVFTIKYVWVTPWFNV